MAKTLSVAKLSLNKVADSFFSYSNIRKFPIISKIAMVFLCTDFKISYEKRFDAKRKDKEGFDWRML